MILCLTVLNILSSLLSRGLVHYGYMKGLIRGMGGGGLGGGLSTHPTEALLILS